MFLRFEYWSGIHIVNELRSGNYFLIMVYHFMKMWPDIRQSLSQMRLVQSQGCHLDNDGFQFAAIQHLIQKLSLFGIIRE